MPEGQVQRRVRRRGQYVHAMEVPPSKPKQRLPWRRIFVRVAVGIGVVALVYGVLFSGWLNIRGVTVKGNTTVSRQAITDQVDRYLAERPVQRNILFVQTKGLAQDIKQSQPTMKSVTIRRDPLLRLQVIVAESQPALIWKTADQLWLLSEDGRVLREASSGEGGLGTIVDTAQLKVQAGDQVADRQFVNFSRDAFSLARQKGIGLESGSIGATTRELNLTVKGGVVIKTDTSRSANEQLQAYQEAMQTAQQQKKLPTEYVDVRVTGRVFYK